MILIFRVNPVEIFRVVADTLILEQVLLSAFLLVLTAYHWRAKRLACAYLIKDKKILIEFRKIPIDFIVSLLCKLVQVRIWIKIDWLVVLCSSSIF